MIMDFVDDHGTKARAAVRRTKCLSDLWDKLFFIHAVQVPTKAHALGCAAEAETVAIARQIGVCIPGKQEDFITS